MIVLFLLLVAFVAFSRGAITLPTSSIVIVGAGPAGLSAALMLERHGCRDITVIEKRSASSFESEKAYLYMLAPNGQKITDLLGMTASIASRSVSSFKMTTLRVVEPTGKVKVKSLPMRMTKEEKYWLPRSALLDCYLEKVDEINNAAEKAGAKPPIRLEFDTSCTKIVVDMDGKLQIDTIQRGKPKQPIRANIVIGCDGIGSGEVFSSPHAVECCFNRMVVLIGSIAIQLFALGWPARKCKPSRTVILFRTRFKLKASSLIRPVCGTRS
jgi:hypothetical protein